jgi:hypothetical protein
MRKISAWRKSLFSSTAGSPKMVAQNWRHGFLLQLASWWRTAIVGGHSRWLASWWRATDFRLLKLLPLTSQVAATDFSSCCVISCRIRTSAHSLSMLVAVFPPEPEEDSWQQLPQPRPHSVHSRRPSRAREQTSGGRHGACDSCVGFLTLGT